MVLITWQSPCHEIDAWPAGHALIIHVLNSVQFTLRLKESNLFYSFWRRLQSNLGDRSKLVSFHMPPRKYKESDGVMQWVNTSKTSQARFKLQEQVLDSNEGSRPIPMSCSPIPAPTIREPGEENCNENQNIGNDSGAMDSFNNLEFPVRTRKVSRIPIPLNEHVADFCLRHTRTS